MIKKEIVIATNLTTAEIEYQLNSVTEKYFSGDSSSAFFEGNIERTVFKILPIFHYNLRGKLRPELIGSFYESGDLRQVAITIQLPKSTQNLLIVVLVINSIVIFAMILFPKLFSIPFWSHWRLLLLGLIATVISFNISYRSKATRSIRILQKLLLARSLY